MAFLDQTSKINEEEEKLGGKLLFAEYEIKKF